MVLFSFRADKAPSLEDSRMGMRGRSNRSGSKRAEPAVVPYEEVRPLLATGDLLLFGGKSTLCRRIQRLTRSPWSHVGLILKIEALDLVLLWEASGVGDMVDLDTGKKAPGVRLIALSEWIARYGEEIALRRLLVERTPEMLAALAAFRREMRGRPYEQNRLELFRASYDGPLGGNHEDLSSLFCSELVAASYQRMGLLPSTPPANEYTPKDFSSSRRPGLKLLRQAKWTREILISR